MRTLTTLLRGRERGGTVLWMTEGEARTLIFEGARSLADHEHTGIWSKDDLRQKVARLAELVEGLPGDKQAVSAAAAAHVMSELSAAMHACGSNLKPGDFHAKPETKRPRLEDVNKISGLRDRLDEITKRLRQFAGGFGELNIYGCHHPLLGSTSRPMAAAVASDPEYPALKVAIVAYLRRRFTETKAELESLGVVVGLELPEAA